MGNNEFTFECQLNEIDGGQTLLIEATKTQKKVFKKLLERGDLTPGMSSLNYGAGNAVYNNAKFYIPSELDVEKSTKRGKGTKKGKGTKNNSDEDELKKISRRLASGGGVMGDKPVLAVRVVSYFEILESIAHQLQFLTTRVLFLNKDRRKWESIST